MYEKKKCEILTAILCFGSILNFIGLVTPGWSIWYDHCHGTNHAMYTGVFYHKDCLNESCDIFFNHHVSSVLLSVGFHFYLSLLHLTNNFLVMMDIGQMQLYYRESAGFHDTLGTCFGEIGHGFVVSLPFILYLAACILSILLNKPYTDDSKKKRILFINVILFIAAGIGFALTAIQTMAVIGNGIRVGDSDSEDCHYSRGIPYSIFIYGTGSVINTIVACVHFQVIYKNVSTKDDTLALVEVNEQRDTGEVTFDRKDTGDQHDAGVVYCNQ